MKEILEKMKMRIFPPSSRSFHAAVEENQQNYNRVMRELEGLSARLDSLGDRVSKLQEEHGYEQVRDMMLFWQLFKNADESLEIAQKRFFRGLPKADGLAKLFQENELKLFSEFAVLCRENDITYWAGSGTLLGAYLYSDIIPWDDDVDVFMPRHEIERLARLAEESETYRVTVVWDWYVPCKQIRFRLKDEDNPAFIDLFPLDYCAGDPTESWDVVSKERKLFVNELRDTFTGTRWGKEPYLAGDDELVKEIEKILQKHLTRINSLVSLIPSQEKATGLVRGIENIDESHSTGPCPLEEWFPVEWMQLHGIDVPVPPAWDKYLHRLYGDYCKIPRDINGHEHVAEDYIGSEKALSAMRKYIQ